MVRQVVLARRATVQSAAEMCAVLAMKSQSQIDFIVINDIHERYAKANLSQILDNAPKVSVTLFLQWYLYV
jgi:hypothetical protein